MAFMELYRAIVPANRIINDNHGQHYRIHMGNIEWLTRQFNEILEGERITTTGRGRGTQIVAEPYYGPGKFLIPNVKEVHKFIDQNIFSIRCEVWRCVNRRFDPQNYAKTFKAPIDLLVTNSFIPDDSWKCVNGITYVGGGSEVWKDRAVRFENDGLPDQLTPDWWNQYSEDYNDILIRVLVEV